MIVQIRQWYGARAQREQRLLQLMAAILIPMLVGLALIRPLSNAYDDALSRHLQAVDRNGRVKALARSSTGAVAIPAAVPDLALFLGDSARQRGIAIEAGAGSGPGSAAISIASISAPTALEWLRSLEADGYLASDVRITPAGGGAVAVTATISGTAQ